MNPLRKTTKRTKIRCRTARDSEGKSSEEDAEEFEESSEDSADESDDSMPGFTFSSEEGEFSSLEEWRRAPRSINSPERAATGTCYASAPGRSVNSPGRSATDTCYASAPGSSSEEGEEENNSETDCEDEEEVLEWDPDCTDTKVVGDSRPIAVEATPKPVATATCPARDPNRSQSRLWLCDTGCPFDLVNRPNLGDLAKHIEKTATPQIFRYGEFSNYGFGGSRYGLTPAGGNHYPLGPGKHSGCINSRPPLRRGRVRFPLGTVFYEALFYSPRGNGAMRVGKH